MVPARTTSDDPQPGPSPHMSKYQIQHSGIESLVLQAPTQGDQPDEPGFNEPTTEGPVKSTGEASGPAWNVGIELQGERPEVRPRADEKLPDAMEGLIGQRCGPAQCMQTTSSSQR